VIIQKSNPSKQWKDGRRGQDGWGRYTRRRKWYRDGELVEITPSTEVTPLSSPTRSSSQLNNVQQDSNSTSSDPPTYSNDFVGGTDYAESIRSFESKSSSFKAGSLRRRKGSRSRASSLSVKSEDEDRPHTAKQADWGIGDEARMGLE